MIVNMPSRTRIGFLGIDWLNIVVKKKEIDRGKENGPYLGSIYLRGIDQHVLIRVRDLWIVLLNNRQYQAKFLPGPATVIGYCAKVTDSAILSSFGQMGFW